MKDVILWLKENGNLKVIDEPLDVELEIAHIAYIEVKKDNSRPILFTKPINKRKNISYDMPVLMNIFANRELTEQIFSKAPDDIAKNIEKLLKLKPPKGLKAQLKMLPSLISLKNVFPKRSKKKALCQEVVIRKNDVDLDKLPILKTWDEDGGAFITMGQVYTESLDGESQNVGMYRLQQYSKNELGMHWQIHKDSSHFFNEYKKAGKKMPVSIGIGGDPLYIWCGQAPMPNGMFEMLLYGFVRGKNAKLVKSLTNSIYIPNDVDIVIEGFVDTTKSKIEGPFGDHTGYYTLKESFPFMEVETITMRKNPTFCATVVGKPPLEDKYMGWATERIFLPMLLPIVPDIIDYRMPENGVFHNLVIVKIKTQYKGHAKQAMHAFWGVGQMSFVKHAIFVDQNAPDLKDDILITEHILNRVHKSKLLISEGVIDHLDHSSKEQFVGGKLGVDATGEAFKVSTIEENIFEKIDAIFKIKEAKNYFTNTTNPITVVTVDKKEPIFKYKEELKNLNLKILIFVDKQNNDINEPYMLLWRIVNNIDALRDIIIEPFIIIDATNKGLIDGYKREWPKDTLCNKEVLDDLQKRGLIDIDEKFIRKFGLLEF